MTSPDDDKIDPPYIGDDPGEWARSLDDRFQRQEARLRSTKKILIITLAVTALLAVFFHSKLRDIQSSLLSIHRFQTKDVLYYNPETDKFEKRKP